MDDYKIALIHGDQFVEKGLMDGSVELIGEIEQDSLHIASLLNYAKSTFSQLPIFSQLTIRHQPEVIAYFLTRLGLTVFFNMTRYDENNLRKYGKIGMLIFPDELTPKQEMALKEFAQNISDFSISINYDLVINDGILNSKTIQGCNHEKPLELLESYFKSKEKNKNL